MRSKLILIIIHIVLAACTSKLNNNHKDFDDGTLIEPPDSTLEITLDNQEDTDYYIFSEKISATSTNGVTSTGLFCAEKTDRVTEFRCGLGNPGSNWVTQELGCYHVYTGGTCSCYVGDNWLDEADTECRGSSLYITDTCGYEKVVTNAPECIGEDGFINTQSRNQVVDAYHSWFKKPVPNMQWTGNINNCDPGTVSLAYQQRVVDQLNYYRAMTGLPLVNMTPDDGRHQAGALLLAANNQLSHYPEDNWKCMDQIERQALGSSNIVLTSNGVSAIDMFIDDWGGSNYYVGHRRWMLLPHKKTYASGTVPGASILGVMLSGSQDYDVDYVAWPNRGFVPYQVLPNLSNRWSFSLKSARFSEATVTVKDITNNINYPVVIETNRSSYSYWDTIVFKPTGFRYSRPSKDTTYEVTIKKVKVSNEYKNYNYRVTVINP